MATSSIPLGDPRLSELDPLGRDGPALAERLRGCVASREAAASASPGLRGLEEALAEARACECAFAIEGVFARLPRLDALSVEYDRGGHGGHGHYGVGAWMRDAGGQVEVFRPEQMERLEDALAMEARGVNEALRLLALRAPEIYLQSAMLARSGAVAFIERGDAVAIARAMGWGEISARMERARLGREAKEGAPTPPGARARL